MMRATPLATLTLLPLVVARAATKSTCKCFPGDACWPSEQEWDAFNNTVGGLLIKTVPMGSPCHDPNYDEALCEELKSQWGLSPIHINSSSSVQAPIFANASCDPFSPRTSACLMGNYVYYAVNASGPNEIAAALRFAEEHNIRLVIRNTAHDYMGRSTGAGGLAVWTHYLKGVEIKDWSDAEYSGKAIKIGAGTEGFEALQSAAAAGLVTVTGECPTVGVAGGYIQNGGHSPLATAFGLAADQTLEFEVVTADGQLITASPSSHPDLFWALSGAGAGNYGVVISATLKAYPDATTSGASFTLAQPGLDYGAVLNAWHAAIPSILDAGTMATYSASNSSLVLFALTGYNRTTADLQSALAPFLASLADMHITLQPNYTTYPSYHTHYYSYFGPLPAGRFGSAGTTLIGGRFLPRTLLPTAPLTHAINTTLHLGVTMIGQAMNVSHFARSIRAVLPQWRDAAVMSAYSLPYDFSAPIAEMRARQDFITREIMPVIEAVTPGAGAYINEADYQQPGWQEVFFGGNYDRLLEVKKRYDPSGLFWNALAVGSEGWVVRGDGRLCEA